MKKEMTTLLRPLEADLRDLLQPWYKDYGFKQLADTREFAAVPRLMNALKDPNSSTRREAARSLGLIGPDAFEATPELIRRLDDAHYDVRRQAAIGLEKIDPHDYPEVPLLVLMNALEDRHYSNARAAAIKIGEMGPGAKRAVRALAKALDNEGNWYESYRYVRVEAARAIAAIGPDAVEAVPALIRAMYSLDPELRREAVRAIGKMGAAAKDAVPVLAHCLDETFVFPFSSRDLHQSANPYGDGTVTEFIDSVDIERINQFMRPVWRHWIFDHRTRREAAWALGEIGPAAKSAVPALMEAVTVKDKWCVCDHDLRIESIRTLGKLGSAAGKSVHVLADAAESDLSNEVRREALSALPNIGSLNIEGVLAALRKALNDMDPDVRVQAIRALAAYARLSEEGDLMEWDAVDEDGVTAYSVCYSSGTEPERCRDAGLNTIFSFRDLNLERDILYRFRIKALDLRGETITIHEFEWSKRDVLSSLRLVMVEDMNEKVRMEAGENLRALMLLRGP